MVHLYPALELDNFHAEWQKTIDMIKKDRDKGVP